MPNQPPVLTREQMIARNAKANETRRKRAAERAASPLRTYFRDEVEWMRLAQKYGVELAPWGEPPTPAVMKKYLRRYRVALREYLDWFGVGKLEDFAKLNPTWPARAFCGLLLENIEAGILLQTSAA
jgi:hypothetical protein